MQARGRYEISGPPKRPECWLDHWVIPNAAPSNVPVLQELL